MERARNRRAMERAWRRQELTESVVMRTVGTLAGEPGCANIGTIPCARRRNRRRRRWRARRASRRRRDGARGGASRGGGGGAARGRRTPLLRRRFARGAFASKPRETRLPRRRRRRASRPVGFAALPPTGSTSTCEKTDRAGSNPATKANIDDGEVSRRRRRVRRFRARTRRRRRRGRPRAPGSLRASVRPRAKPRARVVPTSPRDGDDRV